ncbi:MAG: anti-sigma factor [Bacteroidetes bacterium]|nr:anti-sigma factor [Bacteroidota bacterium]
MAINFPQWFKGVYQTKSDDFSDCDRCLEVLQLIIDGEADQEQQLYFSKHIKNCVSCLDHYHLDQEIKNLIKQKIEIKSVPSDLIESIRNKILETA